MTGPPKGYSIHANRGESLRAGTPRINWERYDGGTHRRDGIPKNRGPVDRPPAPTGDSAARKHPPHEALAGTCGSQPTIHAASGRALSRMTLIEPASYVSVVERSPSDSPAAAALLMEPTSSQTRPIVDFRLIAQWEDGAPDPDPEHKGRYRILHNGRKYAYRDATDPDEFGMGGFHDFPSKMFRNDEKTNHNRLTDENGDYTETTGDHLDRCGIGPHRVARGSANRTPTPDAIMCGDAIIKAERRRLNSALGAVHMLCRDAVESAQKTYNHLFDKYAPGDWEDETANSTYSPEVIAGKKAVPERVNSGHGTVEKAPRHWSGNKNPVPERYKPAKYGVKPEELTAAIAANNRPRDIAVAQVEIDFRDTPPEKQPIPNNKQRMAAPRNGDAKRKTAIRRFKADERRVGKTPYRLAPTRTMIDSSIRGAASRLPGWSPPQSLPRPPRAVRGDQATGNGRPRP